MSRAPPRLETKSTLPSTVHTGDVFRFVALVILTGVPPSAFITHIEEGAILPMSVPLRNPPLPCVNAMCFPSCDHAAANAPALPAFVSSFRSSPFSPVATRLTPRPWLHTSRPDDG